MPLMHLGKGRAWKAQRLFFNRGAGTADGSRFAPKARFTLHSSLDDGAELGPGRCVEQSFSVQ